MKRFFAPSRATAVACVLALAVLLSGGQKSYAAFTVTLDQNWNNGGGGVINGTPPTVTFEDFTNGGVTGVKITVVNSLTPNTSPNVMQDLYLNFGPNPASTTLQNYLDPNNASHLVFSVLSGPATLDKKTGTSYNGEQADGTGGNYDIYINFDPNSELAAGQTEVIFIAAADGSTNFNANTFNNLATGASTPPAGLTVSSHITGGNNPSIFIGGNPTTNPVPAPAGLILALTGMPVLGLRAWTRRRRTTATA